MDQEYNVFIPIGKTIGTVKSVIMNTISELTGQKFINEMILLNKLTGDVYDDEEHDQDEQPYLSAYDVRRQDVTTQYLSQREIG